MLSGRFELTRFPSEPSHSSDHDYILLHMFKWPSTALAQLLAVSVMLQPSVDLFRQVAEGTTASNVL